MSDEGFREIQLNGKQLVFLFMAATVVLVVSFLFGVLVGRGVGPAAAVADTTRAEIAPDPGAAPVAQDPAPMASTPQAPPPVATEAAPSAEELSYAERLLREDTPQEKLKDPSAAKRSSAAVKPPPPPPQPPPDQPAQTATPQPAQTAPPAQTQPASAATAVPAPVSPGPAPRTAPAPAETSTVAASAASDPSGPGYAVQVAAYRDRREADALAKQLIAKGYPAFVMDPVKGAPTTMFRVRVGKYKSLKDAEAVSTRLQRAEQFKPWIAR